MLKSGKKVLVTGGAGFVGTNLIKLLLKKTKHKIISIHPESKQEDAKGTTQDPNINLLWVLL